mgnify:CR=1 FL=1
MSQLKSVLFLCFLSVGYLGTAFAGQFDWLKELELSAKADPSGYAMKLATRFKIGAVEVKTVMSEVKNYSDAYMVLKLGEIAHKKPDTVIEHYNTGKNKGWGVLAKQLGIKPGSREFHKLKRGHDLNLGLSDSSGNTGNNSKSNKKDKNKGKGKGNNKGRN